MECPSCHAPVEDFQKFCKGCGSQMPEPEPDPLLGKVIGAKYRIVKLLGEGGMGAVYHGEQQLGTNVRRVAIKTLHKQLSTDPKVKARFDRECGTIAGLEHPNTIQVYDFGKTDDGQLYIVMEFVQGKSLADALEKGGAMDPARVESILKQICGSLEEAHSQGIVHRDLKPDNIVLTERAGQHDFVKVLDFGIAKRSGEEDKNEAKLTQAGMVLGTPPYMSPEQFTGKPIDVRSDIYSLGVMGYEMITGRLPFEADTAWEWATKHMTAAPMAIEALPTGMRAPERMRLAVMKALAKNVDQRFRSVREFFDAFSTGGGAAGARGGTALLSSPQISSPQISSPGEPPRVSYQSNPGEPVSARGATQGIDAVAAPGFGPPPQGGTALIPAGAAGPQFGAPAAGPHYGTPSGGNVAYPAPPPPQAKKGGGGKIALFALLGVLVLGGAGAGIFFATRGGGGDTGGKAAKTTTSPPSSTGEKSSTGSPDAASTTVAVTTTTDSSDAGSTTTTETFDAGALGGDDDAGRATTGDGGHTIQRFDGGVHVIVQHDAGTHTQPTSCASAALMKKLNRMNEYHTLADKCRREGGVPP